MKKGLGHGRDQRAGEEVSRLYAFLEPSGHRAIKALRSTDPTLVDALLAALESEDIAARWLVGKPVVFGGFIPLEPVSQGEREPVMFALHSPRYGLSM